MFMQRIAAYLRKTAIISIIQCICIIKLISVADLIPDPRFSMRFPEHMALSCQCHLSGICTGGKPIISCSHIGCNVTIRDLDLMDTEFKPPRLANI